MQLRAGFRSGIRSGMEFEVIFGFELEEGGSIEGELFDGGLWVEGFI